MSELKVRHTTLQSIENEKTKEILNQTVADLSQFSVVIHQTHWYMRGTNFLTLHPKMDEYMDDINGHLDVVAERLITIGGKPFSTLQEFLNHTNIKEEIGSYNKSMADHLNVLLENYYYLTNLCANAIEITDEEKDHVTQDIYIGIKGDIEKTIWMLRAELNEAPSL